MSKITISDSDKKLLLIFFAVLIFAGSYFFIFSKNMNKASTLEENNAKDKTTVEQLEMMEKNIPQVKQQITDLKKTQADIIEHYPADMTTEQVIWVLQSIQDNNDFEISEVTFLMNNPLGAADAAGTSDTSEDSSADTADVDTEASCESSTEDGQENSADQVRGYYASIGIKYEADYKAFKDMLQYVNDYKDRITITDVTSTYDSETGKLTGDMTINMYYMTNTGKAYVAPEFVPGDKGVLNIFGGSAE